MRRTLTLILAAVAAAVPVGVAQADGWSDPLTVPRSTTSSAPTQLLFSATERASVIASGNYGGKSQILRAEQDTGYPSFLPFGRAFSGSDTQGAGVFAYNARGDGVMAGLSAKPHGPSYVALRHTRRRHSTFAPRQEYSPGETQATTYRVAINDKGDALVTWVARVHGRHRIAYVMRRIGHDFGARRYLSFSVAASRGLGFRIQPIPAVDDEGNIAVLFGDDRNHRRIATGTLSRTLTHTQDLGPGNSTFMALSLNHGRGIATWLDHREPAGPQLFVSTVQRGAHAFSAPVEIAGDTVVNAELGSPRAVALSDGRFVVATQVDPNAQRQSSSIGIWVSPFTTGKLERVSTDDGQVADLPSLAAGPDGGAVLAFDGRGQTGPASVYATALRLGDSTFGPAVRVGSPSRVLGTAVAGAGPAGRIGVAWNDGAVRVSIGVAG